MRRSFDNQPLKTTWQVAAGFVVGKRVSSSQSEAHADKSDSFGEVTDKSLRSGPDRRESEHQDIYVPEDDHTGNGFSENRFSPSSQSVPANRATDADSTNKHTVHENLRRSARLRKPVSRFTIAFQSTLEHDAINQALQAELESEQEHQERCDPLQAFAASADPDTMYLHEAMKEPDRAEFIKAMEEEVQQHTKNKVWSLVKRTDIPKHVPIIPGVWAMRRKRRIATREVYKWKARLAFDGSRQIKNVNYTETYAPVVGWGPTRLVLLMAVMKNRDRKSVV